MNRALPVLLCCIVLFACFLPFFASAASVTVLNTINIYSNDGSELLFRITPGDAITITVTDYGVTILDANGSTAGAWTYDGDYLFCGISTTANAVVGGMTVTSSGGSISIPAASVKDRTYNYYIVEDTDQSAASPTLPDKYNSSRTVNIYSNSGQYLLFSYFVVSEMTSPPAITLTVTPYGVTFSGGTTDGGWEYLGSDLFVGLAQVADTGMVTVPIGGDLVLSDYIHSDYVHDFYVVLDYDQPAAVPEEEKTWWQSVLGWFGSLFDSIVSLSNNIGNWFSNLGNNIGTWFSNLSNTIVETLGIPDWIGDLKDLIANNFIVDAFTSLLDWLQSALDFFSLPSTFDENEYTFWDYLFGDIDGENFFSWADDIEFLVSIDRFFTFISELWLLIPAVIRYFILFAFGVPVGISAIMMFLR